MCLAIPGELLEILGDDPLTRSGRIAFAGIVKQASLALMPEAKVGDYVLVHAGIVIAVIDESHAEQSLDCLASMEATCERGTTTT